MGNLLFRCLILREFKMVEFNFDPAFLLESLIDYLLDLLLFQEIALIAENCFSLNHVLKVLELAGICCFVNFLNLADFEAIQL